MDHKAKEFIYKTWGKAGHYKSVKKFNGQISVHKKIMEMFHVGRFYWFIFSPSMQMVDMCSESISDVLGYSSADLSADLLVSSIHPDDLPYFLDFENTVVDFKSKLPKEKLMRYKSSYTYRLRTKNNKYIRILQQSTTIESDENGAILRNLVIHTDISHLKSKFDNKMSLSFIGMDDEPSFIDVKPKGTYIEMSNLLTKREKQITQLIAKNMSTDEIAKHLNISPGTVSTHRKNIHVKTGTKNALDLTLLAYEKSWI